MHVSAATPSQLVETLELQLTQPQRGDLSPQRADVIALVCAGLEQFGLDADSLVRYGLGEQLLGAVLAAVVLEAVHAEGSADHAIDAARWREALQLPTIADIVSHASSSYDGTEFRDHISRVRMAIQDWVRCAPFDDLVAFKPPTSEELATYSLEADADPSVRAGYVWLWQRFREPDLRRWDDSSLHQEFKWLEGETSTFAAEVLADSHPNSGDLNYEIARRAVGTESSGDDADKLFWQMQAQAAVLLKEERYVEASALFEFYLRLHPDHILARNNLGFCKMPLDPSSALHHLESAHKGGYSSPAINTYNRCCCLTMLSREGEALDLAENYWQREIDHEGVGGLLWRPADGKWEFYSEPVPNLAIARLATQVASDLGREDRAMKWREREQELTQTWSVSAEHDSDESSGPVRPGALTRGGTTRDEGTVDSGDLGAAVLD